MRKLTSHLSNAHKKDCQSVIDFTPQHRLQRFMLNSNKIHKIYIKYDFFQFSFLTL